MGGHEFFWQWLANVREFVPDHSAHLSAILRRELGKLSREQRIQIAQSYFELVIGLERLEVWEACSLVSGLGCSDDSFAYFKNWILWQGKDAYSKVTANVDELAALIVAGSVDASNPRCEELNVCGYGVVEMATHGPAPQGPIAFEDLQPAFDWLDSTPETMAARMPKLWEMFGARLLKSRADIETELKSQPQVMNVPGLGRLKVGDRLHHKFGYGIGTIKEILLAGSGIALVQFPDGDRRQQVAAESYELATPDS